MAAKTDALFVSTLGIEVLKSVFLLFIPLYLQPLWF